MERRPSNKRAVIDINDDVAGNDQPVEKSVKRENEPASAFSAQEVAELQQKLAKSEKDKQSLIRIAGEAQARVEFLENLIDKKPASVDDSNKQLMEEQQKKIDELTKDRDELARKMSEADEREKKMAEEHQKKIDKLERKLKQFEGGKRKRKRKLKKERPSERTGMTAEEAKEFLPERGKNGRWLPKHPQPVVAVQQQQPAKVPTAAAVTVAPTEDTVAPAARIDAQGDEEEAPQVIKEENVEG